MNMKFLYEKGPRRLRQLTLVPQEVVRHVHRLLIGDLESTVQDGLAEICSDMVVANSLCYRVISGGSIPHVRM